MFDYLFFFPSFFFSCNYVTVSINRFVMYSHDDIYIFFLLTCFAKFHRNQFRNAIEYLLAVTIRVNLPLKAFGLKSLGLKMLIYFVNYVSNVLYMYSLIKIWFDLIWFEMQKRPRSEVALYYTTARKRQSPDFLAPIMCFLLRPQGPYFVYA